MKTPMRILEVMTEHSAPIKVLIEVLKDMLSEVNIEFRNEKLGDDKQKTEQESEVESDDETDKKTNNNDKSGMRIMAIDTTKTVLINLKLEANKFTKFVCKKKKLFLGVNLTNLHKLIKSMDKDDTLTLYVDNDDKNCLKIKIDNPEEKKDSTYKLKLMDLDKNQIAVPDTTFDAVVTMNATEFHKICREMNQIADYVEIKCLEKKIIFTCKGEFAERTTTYRMGNNDNDGDGINIQHSVDLSKNKNAPLVVQGVFELRNLVLFSKCSQLCNDIEIYMKNEYPLVIKYTVATLGRILLCMSPVNQQNQNFSDNDEFYSDDDVDLKK